MELCHADSIFGFTGIEKFTFYSENYEEAVGLKAKSRLPDRIRFIIFYFKKLLSDSQCSNRIKGNFLKMNVRSHTHSLNPIRPGGGGGLRGPDGQTHSCQSETSYPMMPKLGDF